MLTCIQHIRVYDIIVHKHAHPSHNQNQTLMASELARSIEARTQKPRGGAQKAKQELTIYTCQARPQTTSQLQPTPVNM